MTIIKITETMCKKLLKHCKKYNSKIKPYKAFENIYAIKIYEDNKIQIDVICKEMDLVYGEPTHLNLENFITLKEYLI